MAQRLEGFRSARPVDDPLKFRGIIFDIDGTLVDSNDAHAHAFVEAFAEAQLEVPFGAVRRLIGEGSDKLIPELIGRYDEAIAGRKKEIFRKKHLPGLRPTPGARALVAELQRRGAKLAVASSAGEDELGALLAAAQVDDLLRRTTSADDADRSKPDPDIVRAALDKLGLAARECLLIGDTPYDALAAQRAGVAFAGVRCGGWSDGQLQPSVAVVDDPSMLLRRLDVLL